MQKITVLVPAYNEADSISSTIEALLAQTRVPDQIVVIPNGCSDNTADRAREFPVIVLELPKLEHRKSEALNLGWLAYGQDADIVICLDADTFLPPNAMEDWVADLTKNPKVGGSCAKFTVTGDSLLSRIQRAEYSASIDAALRKGSTRVLPGAGCAFRGSLLREIAQRTDRVGPWSYRSATEDFELTYRIREMGYVSKMSETVRAYTDSMRTVKALLGQRMKWQAGTIDDLITFGVNRLTWKDWLGQLMGFFELLLKGLVMVILGVTWMVYGQIEIFWVWMLLPLISIALAVKKSFRIPHRDWKDTLIALSFFPNEWMMWMRSVWYVRSWSESIWGRVSGKKKDFWKAQYVAEGWG